LRTVAYAHGKHAAARTDEYLFSQLVPYIGNKRKLIDLIGQAITQTGAPAGGTFVDFFAGSGIVSRLAKKLGYRVIANDWEPYTQPINECAIGCNAAPAFAGLGGGIAASRNRFIGPEDLTLLVSINVLCLVIIGGMGSIPGVLVGALVLKGLSEMLRELDDYRFLVFGILLIVMMILRPQGLWPSARERVALGKAPVAPEPPRGGGSATEG